MEQKGLNSVSLASQKIFYVMTIRKREAGRAMLHQRLRMATLWLQCNASYSGLYAAVSMGRQYLNLKKRRNQST